MPDCVTGCVKCSGRPDLAFVGCKIAVFVDGCFWHGCQDHYKPPVTKASFWSEKIARNRQRDREVENALGALGWTVLRYWEHEVEGDPATVVDRIRAAVARSPRRTVLAYFAKRSQKYAATDKESHGDHEKIDSVRRRI